MMFLNKSIEKIYFFQEIELKTEIILINYHINDIPGNF